jgi:hypothetical protein
VSDADFLAILAGPLPIHPQLLPHMAAVLADHGAPVPPLAAQLVEQCTARDPLQRPTFAELASLTAGSAGGWVDATSLDC